MKELIEPFDLFVIIPVFNKEGKVTQSIESCLQQSYKNFHICIIDDCSTDNSYNEILKYEDNKKITILKNDVNKGCYYSRNLALETFKDYPWKYFTVHDSDDASTTERFQLCINKFNEDDNNQCVMTPYLRMYKNNKNVIKQGDGIAFFSKEVFLRIGYFDDTRFAGDSEYLERLNRYSNLNKWGKIVGLDLLTYFATDDKNNLTNKYNEHKRKKYKIRMMTEIDNMIKINNFYKEFYNERIK